MKKFFHYNFHREILNYDNSWNTRVAALLSRQLPYDIQIIAENLRVPWAIAINTDGSIYFTERPGTVRAIKNDRLLPEPLITFPMPFITTGEGGLMGIALDPNFSQNHYFYVMHTYTENNKIYNRVVQLVENNNSAFINKILIDKIPGAQFHNGGRIKIGPDEKLYITTGDAGNPKSAQDLTSLSGKILRIELDGSIPKDNPFPSSPVYSLGHRNPQGLAWSTNNILYESEHGQTAHDEINIIKPGANYGWPLVQGDEESKEILVQKPLIQSGDTTWAPSGIAYITEGPWQGKLLVATLRGAQLLSISLNGNGTKVTNVASWLANDFGRLREVVQGGDGAIYIATSNRDGRGNPQAGDDKIIKLIPKR